MILIVAIIILMGVGLSMLIGKSKEKSTINRLNKFKGIWIVIPLYIIAIIVINICVSKTNLNNYDDSIKVEPSLLKDIEVTQTSLSRRKYSYEDAINSNVFIQSEEIVCEIDSDEINIKEDSKCYVIVKENEGLQDKVKLKLYTPRIIVNEPCLIDVSDYSLQREIDYSHGEVSVKSSGYDFPINIVNMNNKPFTQHEITGMRSVTRSVLTLEVPVGYKVKSDMFINRTNIE